MTDPELVRRMAGGDEQAFAALYRRRQGGIYRFVLHMTGDAQAAEEVTQDVFLTLIREAPRYDPGRGSVAAYLYGIARNYVFRRLEQDSRYVSFEEDEHAGAISAADDPLADLAREERLEALRRAVLSLPPPYREAITLCDLHEMDYTEAAQVLGCPVGTVRSRLHRARALLAAKLREKPARCTV